MYERHNFVITKNTIAKQKPTGLKYNRPRKLTQGGLHFYIYFIQFTTLEVMKYNAKKKNK